MRTAVSKTKKRKNRSNLGAIFSALQAAKVAIFGRLVILERVYRVSKIFSYYYIRFLMMIPFRKKPFLIFFKNSTFFRKYLYTVPYNCSIYTTFQNFFHITTSGLEPRPLELRYPYRKKSTNFDAKLQKIEHDDPQILFY